MNHSDQVINRPAQRKAGVTNKPLLTLTNVDKTFGNDVVALKNLNLDIQAGEFLSLLGPSGCGKSTALRLVAGLMEPNGGSLSWDEQKYSANLGFVFQEPTLMPWCRVKDNVWLPLRLQGRSYRESRDQVEHALELVGLEKFKDAFPRELSGGMKMRVSIARAIVTQPLLMLMDEPFAALDEITRHKLNQDLLQLKEKTGCTIVFVTHSVFESVFLSDRILIMAARPGRVIRELTIDPTEERDETFRTSAQYGDFAREVSRALHQSMSPTV